jgi:signal transduction histidine kinase
MRLALWQMGRSRRFPTSSVLGGTDLLIHRLNSDRKSISIPNLLDFQRSDVLSDSEQIHTLLVVPIIASDKVIGLAEFGKVDPDPYPPEQIEWAEALVAQAAVAIQNAWLFEQVSSSSERLQSLAHKLVEIQEKERSSIARELHDEAGQALASLKLSLGMLESDPGCSQHVRQRLKDLKVLADRVLEDLHRLAMDLRPVALDRLGLVAAVEQLAHDLDSDWLSIRFKAVGFEERRLSPNLETALYRIAGASASNACATQASSVGIL